MNIYETKVKETFSKSAHKENISFSSFSPQQKHLLYVLFTGAPTAEGGSGSTFICCQYQKKLTPEIQVQIFTFPNADTTIHIKKWQRKDSLSCTARICTNRSLTDQCGFGI